MCCRQLAEKIHDAKKSPSGITQLCPAIFSQLRHVSTIGKNLLNSNTSSTCPHNMVNFGPLTAEICWRVWGTRANFSQFRILASVLQGTPVVDVSQTLRRWTDGATYIRQGGHHVGHWPTFWFFNYWRQYCQYYSIRESRVREDGEFEGEVSPHICSSRCPPSSGYGIQCGCNSLFFLFKLFTYFLFIYNATTVHIMDKEFVHCIPINVPYGDIKFTNHLLFLIVITWNILWNYHGLCVYLYGCNVCLSCVRTLAVPFVDRLFCQPKVVHLPEK